MQIYSPMQIEHKGDKVLITVDVSADALAKAQPSKSGKTRLVATTSGFTRCGPVSLSLNVTAPAA